LRTWVAGRSRLAYLASRTPEALRSIAAPELLLGCADTPPADAAGWAAPSLVDIDGRSAQWRAADPSRLLLLRLRRCPTEQDLELALAAGVDELVVSLPDATTLDEQLAGFAEIAERLAVGVQPVD
jgi:hypothetical protein